MDGTGVFAVGLGGCGSVPIPWKGARDAGSGHSGCADVSDTSTWADYLAKGDTLVYGVNPPYDKWHTDAFPYLESALEVAERKDLTLLFPGNVYGFDPDIKAEFSEQDKPRAPTAKGELRVQMEARLQQASENGVRVIVLRAGDFIDPYATDRSNWFRMLLSRGAKRLVFKAAGEASLAHCWAYLPDLAQTIERLVRQSDDLPAFSVFPYRGVVCSAQQMVETLRQGSSESVELKPMYWLPLRVIAWFSPSMREVLAMRYLWDKALVLDDQKLQRRLAASGGVPETSLPEALKRLLPA